MTLSLSIDIVRIFPCIKLKRENNLIVDSIVFFGSSTIKKLFNANNRQNKTLHFRNCRKMPFFLAYFSKAVVGENGPKIRHKLLNLVWLGGKFPFQCNLILVYLGM